MRTFCPHCQTTFRITPEQLKARAGKVRCGQCQTVFNALDCLLDEDTPLPVVQAVSTKAAALVPPATSPASASAAPQPSMDEPESPAVFPPAGMLDFPSAFPLDTPERSETEGATTPAPDKDLYWAPARPEWAPAIDGGDTQPPPSIEQPPTGPSFPPLSSPHSSPLSSFPGEGRIEPQIDQIGDFSSFGEIDTSDPFADTTQDNIVGMKADNTASTDDTGNAVSETRLRELGKTTGLILPRETTEIPGYSRWAEDPLSSHIALPDEKPSRWPFVLVALILALLLAGQVIFHYRSEIAVAAPSVRPLLELFSETLNSKLPLPRHVELVSIEASDLQTDRTRNNLLVLTATLRNRARYAQAYPSLELSLTDTGDTAIVRRVFGPDDYLSPKPTPDQPFAASTDVAVRLWIEAKDVTAAGYRLYVFYP